MPRSRLEHAAASEIIGMETANPRNRLRSNPVTAGKRAAVGRPSGRAGTIIPPDLNRWRVVHRCKRWAVLIGNAAHRATPGLHIIPHTPDDAPIRGHKRWLSFEIQYLIEGQSAWRWWI